MKEKESGIMCIIEKALYSLAYLNGEILKFVMNECSDRDGSTCKLFRARNGEEGREQDPRLAAFYGRETGKEKTRV